MLGRYSREEMAQLWTSTSRYSLWMTIELLACEARAARDEIPASTLKHIQESAAFDEGRIAEIEKEVKHDVIAFLTSIAESVGPDSRFIHLGLTSSDILDTALAVQLARAATLLREGVERVKTAARVLAETHADTVMMGRSHGIHAEPITFGLKAASWYQELCRAEKRVLRAKEIISYGKLSGAVGTYAQVPPEIEQFVCAQLELKPEPVSTQIIPRDRHAEYFNLLALVGCSVERIAVEVRHLQRTEVGELQEPFGDGQKGSSAMPHKRNPILSENLTGLARLLRGYAQSALENVALWHERDISHSSVERVIGPDATTILDFALHRLGGMLEGLVVNEVRMGQNLASSGGLFNSQGVLLALIDSGMTREKAYGIVQKHALAAWEDGGTFRARLEKDGDVSDLLSAEQLEALFDPKRTLGRVHWVLERSLKDQENA